MQLLDMRQDRLSPSGGAAFQIPILQGSESLTTYTFNTGTAKHLFCSVCGIKSFYVPRSHPDGYSVNVRCLDPSTIERVEIKPFNGREWEKQYPEGRGKLPDD